jgi:uncharacterized protein YndB with AHSA1/START domain
MADIRHRVGIDAPADRVYQALATRQGLAGWWTRTVEGDPGVGQELRFFFGQPEPSATMQVRELVPGQRVAWRCVGGPDEWRGTDLTFELKPAGEETTVLFSHTGWREPVEFLHHCSTKWAQFLLGLKAGLEGGRSTPFPEDQRISSWG